MFSEVLVRNLAEMGNVIVQAVSLIGSAMHR